MRVHDLHCDLLAYLAMDDKRSAYDSAPRCGAVQLQKGGVAFQVLAIFTETGPNSVREAEKQFTLYRTLAKTYPDKFQPLTSFQIPERNHTVALLPAIENASGLAGESEPLEYAFSRLDQYSASCGPLLYLGLTWHHENRFGGGNQSKKGLKRDGELLLEYLDGKKIAIDLSHTSDALANGILEYIDAKKLDITPIASHSNFRSVAKFARNLPDDIAKEIFRKGGVIGLNFVKAFAGRKFPEDFFRQMEHAEQLGGEDLHCLGADFFCDEDSPMVLSPFVPFFSPEFGDSSCYPRFLELARERFGQERLEKLAHKNFENFLCR